MNQAGIRAIETALGNAEDNLHRAKVQQGADSEWVSGNGESIGSMIGAYERTRDDLKVALDQARAS